VTNILNSDLSRYRYRLIALSTGAVLALVAAFGLTGGRALAATMSPCSATTHAPCLFGPAADGGYWAIGLREADPRALIGVPMSSRHTLSAQRTRLAELGLTVRELPMLRDVDTYDDALSVAAGAPGTPFERAFATVGLARAAA